MSARVLTGSHTGSRTSVDESVDDGSSGALDGWFCIEIDETLCEGCGRKYKHVIEDGTHEIVVWPEIDDPNLLKQAQGAKNLGHNPRVKEYEKSLGACISFYALTAH